MENARYADLLEEIAELVELTGGGGFRARSYHHAASTLRDLERPVEDLARAGEGALVALEGIGRSTARDILQIADRGTCDRLEGLRAEVPPGVPQMMRVGTLGPKTAMRLHRELGIESLDELRRACQERRVRRLRGLGPKAEANILEGIRLLQSVADRTPLHLVQAQVDALAAHLAACPAIARHTVAGSFRRRRETVGDLDVVVIARDRAAAAAAVLAYDPVDRVLARGREKISLRLDSGLQVDVRFVDESQYGAALVYFTGSKEHNVALRQRALQAGWKLNEYGLFDGEELLAGRSEEELYARFGLAWIPPELREDRGELEAAAADHLPQLVALGDIRGDLHCHTTASDGRLTLREMALAAKARGHRYLAITDHSKALPMIQGLDEARLARHAAAIRELDAELEGFWLLAGIEVDILEDGTLDLEPEALAGLDWVIASVHAHFQLDAAAQTRRLLSAIESGVVDCLGHPLGRMRGRREAMAFDRDAVFTACREHRVALEINASPGRLDLPDTAVRHAVELGVELVIDTDAHGERDLDHLPLGVDVARRGWATRRQVLNTRTIPQLRRRLKRR